MEEDISLTPEEQAKVLASLNAVIGKLGEANIACYYYFAICSVYQRRAYCLNQFAIGDVPSTQDGNICLAKKMVNRLACQPMVALDMSNMACAIRGDIGLRRIFFLSGLPRLANQAGVLLVAKQLGDISHAMAMKIAESSNNRILLELLT